MSDATDLDVHDASPLLAARARPSRESAPLASKPANNGRPAPRRSGWRRWVLAGAVLAAVGFFAANVAVIRGATEATTAAGELSMLLASSNATTSSSSTQGVPAATSNATTSNATKPAATEADTRPKPPFRTPNMDLPTPMSDDVRSMCFDSRDYGLIPVIREAGTKFCTHGPPASAYSSPRTDNVGVDDDVDDPIAVTETLLVPSTYTYYKSPRGNLVATVMNSVTVDFRHIKVAADISDVSNDGYYHDPRFNYKSMHASCACALPQNDTNGAPRVWNRVFAGDPSANYTVCDRIPPLNVTDADIMVLPAPATATHAVALARKDDHNPFFQISAALNAWILMQALNWSVQDTQLVWLDKGFPTPVDALQHAVLAPNHPVVAGTDLMGRVVRFESVLLAPYEMSGPMMFHLDDSEPCHNNSLMTDFRAIAIDALGVSPVTKREPKACLVTVITRKPYGGRKLQRMWLNEDEILSTMRSDYAGAYSGGACTFQSVDFVNLTIHEQIRIVLDSDVVIGMHGAGMVNVMWARPGTLVIEIFPIHKHRWGYRNMCQNVGCRWFDFRGGKDVGSAKDQHKIMNYDEWKAFFDPLFWKAIAELEAGR
jgi:glycoprotein 2-beta-D-xylosyltransferase